ncbi:ectoine/hydroxyectoine ABC transporter ATP-binding protein EhuA [Salinibacterium sp. SWN167]|uniref:ectoine/hydroxyectoine ABC transporter ATP-binding protein EhuA n=1 Tax=Salinibacterium sp. SWN167 TaxID=2792054 RepID=UPI001E2B7CD9|nr:ectoine/hydroxyectoine ABC transporter ATP-binding protein EhuA [Salinibacterium sp. SWN167]
MERENPVATKDDVRSDQPMVEFRNVVKRYDQTVLDNLDLVVGKGDKSVIIGPSGSGKTTILRILMTLVRPEEGQVLIDGTPLWTMEKGGQLVDANDKHLREMRNSLGMVFQQFNLFPHMTVLRNVTEGLIRVQGMSKDQAEEEALANLDRVGLRHRASDHTWQLSGGQQQRVAIARAIALKPRVLLFDEVTSALDPELVGEVLEVIRDLAFNTNITMLFVTHEMRFAREIADNVIMFDRGQVVEQGPPAQIFDDPRELRTQDFLRKVT